MPVFDFSNSKTERKIRNVLIRRSSRMKSTVTGETDPDH